MQAALRSERDAIPIHQGQDNITVEIIEKIQERNIRRHQIPITPSA
jgi:hypothetical protein